MKGRIALKILPKPFVVSLLAGFVAMAAAGCMSSPQVVPTTGPHPATTIDQVKIYQTPPAQYELLGEIVAPVSANVKWDDQGNADEGFDLLKGDAAVVGANGLLLVAPEGKSNLSVIAGYHGTMYKVPIWSDPKTAVAEAIWVIKE